MRGVGASICGCESKTRRTHRVPTFCGCFVAVKNDQRVRCGSMSRTKECQEPKNVKNQMLCLMRSAIHNFQKVQKNLVPVIKWPRARTPMAALNVGSYNHMIVELNRIASVGLVILWVFYVCQFSRVSPVTSTFACTWVLIATVQHRSASSSGAYPIPKTMRQVGLYGHRIPECLPIMHRCCPQSVNLVYMKPRPCCDSRGRTSSQGFWNSS